jgi:hypothetical protein
MLPYLLYETSIVLTQEPDKDTIIKSYQQISLMNIDAKILNTVLANWLQQYIKKILYYDQVCFILGMQGWFSICKSIKINTIHRQNQEQKTHKIISKDSESLWQNSTSFPDKSPEEIINIH